MRRPCIEKRVVEKRITYVGLDVRKDTMALALADEGKRGDVREHGKTAVDNWGRLSLRETRALALNGSAHVGRKATHNGHSGLPCTF